MTGFPSAEDYLKAVQQPGRVFRRPDLASAVFDVNPLLQIPVPASGTTAVVFKATVAGRPQALRFFTREDASTRQRYTALNAWFTQQRLTDLVASCAWVDDAIEIGGRRWPMVAMEWVEGHPLDQHVEDLVAARDAPALAGLATNWRDLVRRTQAARFAHGDLQHGNVLVDPAGRLRLVDFDSSWIAPFAGSAPPNEAGHRNYQPTQRTWGPWMDTFPALVIYLSLLVLARDPRQWEQLNDGENLLFTAPDYAPPHRTHAWQQVSALHDPHVDQLADRLRACCLPGWAATGDLESLIAAPRPWWLHQPIAHPVPATPQPSPQRPTPYPRDTPPTALRHGDGASPPPVAPAGTTWWQQPGSQPAAPPMPSTPDGGGTAGRTAREAIVAGGRIASAIGTALLVFLVGFGLFDQLVAGAGGLPGSAAAVTGAGMAVVPALIVLLALIRRRKRT